MLNHILYNGVSSIPRGGEYIERPHINELLREAMQRPLVTVVAGAGYGKTQAVSAFLREYEADVIWIQLLTLDNLLARLWSRFIYAVSLRNETLAGRLNAFGFPDTLLSLNEFLDVLTSSMIPGKRYVLVLDDFHLITAKEVLQLIATLVEARISALTIILISRTQPEINVKGMFTGDICVAITENDLKFKKDEMQTYLTVQGAQLSEQMAANIYEYTDGWIVAIYLIGLGLKKGVVFERNPFSALKVDIFRLIENEIFLGISEELQQFLITLSLIENLPQGLLKELSEHNPELLSQMMRISSFIHYDAFLSTYRIHHLFMEFLQEKQAVLSQEQRDAIHRKAADWYLRNGYSFDAIMHYEKIDRYDEIIEIMLSYASLDAKTALFMLGVLDKMPEEFCAEKPIAHVLHAKYLISFFRLEQANAELRGIVEKYGAMPPSDANRAILGEAYMMLGLVSLITSFYDRKFEFIHLFKMADECLPSGSIIIDNGVHLSQGTYACMVMRSEESGLFEAYNEAMCEAMPYAARAMNGCGHGMEYLCMAEAAYYKRNLKDAERYGLQAIYKSQEKGQYDIESMATFYLIRVSTAQGDYLRAMELLAQLRRRTETMHVANYVETLNIAEGWFYAMIGQPKKVAGWIRNVIESDNLVSEIPFAMHHLIRARCYMAERQYFELLAFLEQGADPFGFKQFLIGAVETKVLMALALYYTMQHAEAIRELEEAYRLAHPNGIIMPFIETGNYMRTLINAATNDESCTIPHEWLENIYTKSATYAKRLAHVAAGYKSKTGQSGKPNVNLTKREHLVLMCLCQGMKREEIADDCNLSVNTVKSMLQTIYNKLGAANSLEAVRIATLLDL